jgi:hypothetical protein
MNNSPRNMPQFVRVHPRTGQWQGADDQNGPWHSISAPPPGWTPVDNWRSLCRQKTSSPPPDDPVEFLEDCVQWWAWLYRASPEEITRYPVAGHLL